MKKLTEEECPPLQCPAKTYIDLPPMTQADEPDFGGGSSPFVSMHFLHKNIV